VEDLVAFHGSCVIAEDVTAEYTGDAAAYLLALEPSALEKAEELGRGGLAGEPQAVDIGAQVLVLLEGDTDGPVAVGAVGEPDGVSMWLAFFFFFF
jgi:hypothetical protein